MRVCHLLPALLLGSLAGRAQQAPAPGTVATTALPPTAYQVQYDSLLARAQRIRAQVAARTEDFRAGFMGLQGTRRKVVSFGHAPRQPVVEVGQRAVMLKQDVVKHKTHGAQLRKAHYYLPGRGHVLYEYFEDGHLAQLELYNYPLPNATGGPDYVTMRWVQGDYLLVRQTSRTSRGSRVVQNRTFVQPAALPAN